MAIPVIDDFTYIKEDGYNDITRTIIGGLLSAAAIASAAYNINRAVSIAQDEWQLAKKYWRLAERWLDYYKDYYVPVEDREINEARNLKTETPYYMVARGRAKVNAWQQFRGLFRQAIRPTSKYCTGKRKEALEALAVAQSTALALCDGLGYRNERGYIEARDDVRFKKQMETAKRGRDFAAEPVSFALAAAGIYGDTFKQAWQGLEGSGQFLGYILHRQHNTYYPTYMGNPVPSSQPGEVREERSNGAEPIMDIPEQRG